MTKAKRTCKAATIRVTCRRFPHNRQQAWVSSWDGGDGAAQLAPYLKCGLPRSRGGSARSISNRLHAINRPAATRQVLKLHDPVAHTGSSGSVDPAGSPARLGWRSGKVKADRTSEDAKSAKTKPRKANQYCHKSCCGSAFNSSGAEWLQVQSQRSSFLHNWRPKRVSSARNLMTIASCGWFTSIFELTVTIFPRLARFGGALWPICRSYV